MHMMYYYLKSFHLACVFNLIFKSLGLICTRLLPPVKRMKLELKRQQKNVIMLINYFITYSKVYHSIYTFNEILFVR